MARANKNTRVILAGDKEGMLYEDMETYVVDIEEVDKKIDKLTKDGYVTFLVTKPVQIQRVTRSINKTNLEEE